MTKGIFILIFAFLFASALKLQAAEFFFLSEEADCKVFRFEKGKFTPLNSENFSQKTILARPMERNPKLSLFKSEGSLFVTKTDCLSALIKPSGTSKPEQKVSKKNLSPSFFLEGTFGIINFMGSDSVVEDYNQVFPSVTTNPTSWGTPVPGKKTSGKVMGLGLGQRLSPSLYSHFQIQAKSGQKSDEVVLNDVNSGLSQSGQWTFKDSSYTAYAGLRYFLMDAKVWKASIGLSVGLCFTSTTLTDESSEYKLSSLLPAGLFEAGVDYMISNSFGIGTGLGYEYLGNRSMKFSNERDGKNFKTKTKYNNFSLSLVPKFYF